MGMFRDHFSAEYEGHKIELETYSGGMFSYCCALFVDECRVDSTRYGFLFAFFTLRHRLGDGESKLRIRVNINHWVSTSARLFINDKEVPFPRLK